MTDWIVLQEIGSGLWYRVCPYCERITTWSDESLIDLNEVCVCHQTIPFNGMVYPAVITESSITFQYGL